MNRAAVLLLVVAAWSAACGRGAVREHPPASEPPLGVAVETATESAWPRGPRITATVLPLRRATPGALLLGRVERVLSREGRRVAAGEVLASLEVGEVRAHLAQAEAAVAAARAGEENARRLRERMTRLREREATSAKSLDDAVAAHEAALAQFHAAEEGVHAAQTQVTYGEVRAPFAGWITERRVEVGDMAAPGVPLFVVEDVSRVQIEAAVPESALAAFTPGAPVEVEVAAGGPAVRSATVTEILPAADPHSRTFTVRALLDNADGALRSGMFATLRLAPAALEGPGTLSVPETALLHQGPLAGLFVVDAGDVARLRWIVTGAVRDGRVEVLTGLAPGERFVASPPPQLADGRRIEVR